MKTEVLVVGGGPAGVAAAVRLVRGGAQVALVERERFSAHKVCGEFLSVEALGYLQQLGIDLATSGAVPLESVRLVGRAHVIERALPFPAMSLTRRCLDSELLRTAESAGVTVRRGCPVEHLVRARDAWQATLAGNEQMMADTVFLASGKHDVRGHPRPRLKTQGMVAFKMYWRLSAAETRSLGRTVELITYPGGYAGLQPVESGMVNLCCLIQADELRRLGGKWDCLLEHMCRESAHLRRRLLGAEPQLLRPLTIASLPYGFVRKSSDGLWYLGDQAVVIPSLTGDGMSLALHTGMLAASMYLRQESSHAYQQAVAKHVGRQVAVASSVSHAMVNFAGLAMFAARFWPGALRTVAQHTRIDRALWADRLPAS